jgi:hypothetical protein
LVGVLLDPLDSADADADADEGAFVGVGLIDTLFLSEEEATGTVDAADLGSAWEEVAALLNFPSISFLFHRL